MKDTPSEETEQGKENGSPSSPSEASQKFFDDKAKEKPSEENKEENKEEACDTCGDEKGDGSPASKVRFVNEKGEEVPFVYEVDGKSIEVTDDEDLRKKAQFGHKGYDVFGELNRREKAIATKEKEMEGYYKMLEPYAKAAQEGKLTIAGEEKAVEEEKEIEFDDPEEEMKFMRKKITDLSKIVETQGKTIENQTRLIGNKIIEEEYTKLTSKLEKLKADEYSLASIKDAWQYLSDDPECTPEEAMKKSQAEREKDFMDFAKKKGLKEMTEEDRQAEIAKYLKEKEEKEKAPVGAPSVEAAGGAGEKETKITSPEMGSALFFKKLAKKRLASKQT